MLWNRTSPYSIYRWPQKTACCSFLQSWHLNASSETALPNPMHSGCSFSNTLMILSEDSTLLCSCCVYCLHLRSIWIPWGHFRVRKDSTIFKFGSCLYQRELPWEEDLGAPVRLGSTSIWLLSWKKAPRVIMTHCFGAGDTVPEILNGASSTSTEQESIRAKDGITL